MNQTVWAWVSRNRSPSCGGNTAIYIYTLQHPYYTTETHHIYFSRHWFYVFPAARLMCICSVLLLLYGRTIYSVILGWNCIPDVGVRALHVVYIIVRLAHKIERAHVHTCKGLFIFPGGFTLSLIFDSTMKQPTLKYYYPLDRRCSTCPRDPVATRELDCNAPYMYNIHYINRARPNI